MLMVKILPTSNYGFHDSFPFDKPVPARWLIGRESKAVMIDSIHLKTDDDPHWLDEEYCFPVGTDCEVVEE